MGTGCGRGGDRVDGWGRAELPLGFVGERRREGVGTGWGRRLWEGNAKHTEGFVVEKGWGRGWDGVGTRSMGGEG